MAILEALPLSRSLGRKLKRAERWERVEKALDHFGLTHIRHTPAGRASGGEKRRLEIARCLVCEPLLILLDEPFAGVDPITKAEIRQTVANLVKTQPIGILLTDHDIHEVLKVTHRSYLIKDGKVRMHGTPEEWVRNPIAVNEYLGTTFSDNGIGTAPTEGRALRTAQWGATPSFARSPEPAIVPLGAVLEQERIHRLIEELRNDSQARTAAQELAGKGTVALPALLDALERREPELRQRAAVIVQSLVGNPLAFDPVGPEAVRRQQLVALRAQLDERKAS
jgi:lipopolysaccharide export system ATP-binding protein